MAISCSSSLESFGSASSSQGKHDWSIDQVGSKSLEQECQQAASASIDVPDHALRYAVDVLTDKYSGMTQNSKENDLDWEDITKKLSDIPLSHTSDPYGHHHYQTNAVRTYDYPFNNQEIQGCEFYPHDIQGQWAAPDNSIMHPPQYHTAGYNNIPTIGGRAYMKSPGNWNNGYSHGVRDTGEIYGSYKRKNISYNKKLARRQSFSRSGKAEGDYLFSEELVKKRKFRLMINPTMENNLKAEFPNYKHSVEAMIEMKFESLGVPVKVKAYCRQDKNIDKSNTKAFNVIFNNYRDVKTALDLTKNEFPMKEARPSPNYYVKYVVMSEDPVFVHEGKCFSKQLQELRKGDIVTANQLKGNKLRVINCTSHGSNVEHALRGWVLLQTKDKELLRRINWVDGEVVMTENRPNFETLIPREWQSVEPRRQLQPVHKSNPQRVSAKRCSPFRVLTTVDVCKSKKEPTVIYRLSPGTTVWANQHKGSMLRIVKMDEDSNIKLDSENKPEVWGWVSLKRKGDEKPRLERLERISVQRSRTSTLIRERSTHDQSRGNPEAHKRTSGNTVSNRHSGYNNHSTSNESVSREFTLQKTQRLVRVPHKKEGINVNNPLTVC